MKRVSGQMSESMLAGALLAVVGGFLDLYSYLCRGGVFANAQTGNLVLLGLEIAQGRPAQALRYALPVAMFAVGVAVAELVRQRYQHKRNIHWRQIIVLVETALLAAAAFAPQSWNMLVNSALSFVCALQVEAFRKVRGSAFATTMCTGNLRSGTEQLMIWRRTGDVEAARRCRRYYGIILFFVAGAALGCFATQLLAERALLAPCAVLLVVFGVMFVREEGQ